MDLNQISRSYSRYRILEVVKREVEDMTVQIAFCRMNLSTMPIYPGVVITPTTTFLSKKVWHNFKSRWDFLEMETMINKMMFEFTSEYTLEIDINRDFNQLSVESFFCDMRLNMGKAERIMKEMMHVPTRWRWYFLSMNSSEPSMMRNENRFFPVSDELNLAKAAMREGMNLKYSHKIILTAKDFSKDCRKVEFLQMKIKELLSWFTSKRQFRKKDKALSLVSDYQSTILTSMLGKLTPKKMDFFQRARHDIFGQVVIRSLGLELPSEFDVNINDKFSYTGPDYLKTPDFMLEDENKLTLLDFAVTVIDPGVIREKKKKKYDSLAAGLERHLGRRVIAEAIVWKIDSSGDFQFPPGFEHLRKDLEGSQELDFLRQMQFKMMQDDDYHKYKGLEDLDEDEKEVDQEYLSNILSELMSAKCNFQNGGRKMALSTSDVGWSRTDISIQEKLSYPKIQFSNTEFCHKLERMSKMDHEGYLSSIQMKMEKMVEDDSFPEHNNKFNFVDLQDVLKSLEESQEKQKLIRKDKRAPNPKLLPFPYILPTEANFMKDCPPLEYDLMWNSEVILDDGTILFKDDYGFLEQTMDEKNKKMNNDTFAKGIGLDELEDTLDIEEFLFTLLDDSGINTMDMVWEKHSDFDSLWRTNLWAYVYFISDMFENLAYLEGRRFVNKEEGISKKMRKSMSVTKHFGRYALVMKAGSRLTKEKQIRFKIIFSGSDKYLNCPSMFKRVFPFKESKKLFESKWLTASSTDFRHYMKLREVVTALFSSFLDKKREMQTGSNRMPMVLDKSFATVVLVLLEHSRGTSTTNQLWRYLLHSATSFVTNRASLAEDINSDPIRSRLEAYIRIKQKEWYWAELQDSKKHWFNRIRKVASKSPDYDRFYMRSPFDLDTKMEFSLLMDYIYITNLFDKEKGFNDHRVKAIMSKMSLAEMKFNSNKDRDWSKGEVKDLNDFWKAKDNLHMFDLKWVISMTKYYFTNKCSLLKFNLALDKALSETIESAMMMTSSLTGGPVMSKTLKYSTHVEKTKTFLSLFDMINTLDSHTLFEMNSKLEEMDAIFALFPKQQIGGPREILIQSVTLRVCVKFLETVCRELCSIHEKEMITKDKQKAEIQSSCMSSLREEMMINLGQNRSSLTFSFNSDASKWSPGFVMEHFLGFIYNWPLPVDLKNYLCSIVSSFSSKIMLTPDNLREKWKNKPTDQKENLEELQWFREQDSKNGGFVEIKSGMGQGMFHFLSSIYHCVTDDCVEMIMRKVFVKKMAIRLTSRALISSDDKTRFSLMVFMRGPHDAEKGMRFYMSMMDCLYRLSNIHTNWKKSGLNFTMAEFNSLFSVGKRMTWATVKDIYNSNNIPDLSIPEDAVQEMLSNVRRCLEHGMHMTTIQVIMNMAHNQLKRYYKMSDKFVREMCTLLNCKEERLPTALGFFPTKNIMCNLLFGKDVGMYSQHNSKELSDFYWNLYSATCDRTDQSMKHTIPFTEDSRGRFWMEVPMNMDKELSEMKLDFFRNKLGLDQEQLVNVLNSEAINFNLSSQDPKMMRVFSKTFFIGMKRNYSFNVLANLHSLIRALQYSTKRAMIFPKSKSVLELEDRRRQLINQINDKKSTSNKTLEELINMRDELKLLDSRLDLFRVDIKTFAEVMLKMKSETSGFNLKGHLHQLMDEEDQIMSSLKNCYKDFKTGHPIFKKVRFHLEDKGLTASPTEMTKYLFENSFEASNYVVETTKQVFQSVGLNLNREIFMSPFEHVRKMMKGSKFPMKEFWDFLNLNFKAYRNMELVMMVDFQCQGNFKDNLRELIYSRAHPSYHLVSKKQEIGSKQKKIDYLTNMSLGKGDIRPREDCVKITEMENKLVKCMKLTSVSWLTRESCRKVESRKVEYSRFNNQKKGCVTNIWFNFNLFVQAEEFEKVVYLYVYSPSNLETTYREDFNLWNILDKYLFEMTTKGSKIQPKTRGNYCGSAKTFYNRTELHFLMKLVRRASKWEIWMDLFTKSQTELSQKDNSLGMMKMYTDYYTVDLDTVRNLELEGLYGESVTLDGMRGDPPSIEELDQIIMNNNLVKKIFIPGPGEDQKMVDRKEILDFNSLICSSAVMDSMIKMFKMGQFDDTLKEIEEEEKALLKGTKFDWSEDVIQTEEILNLPEEEIRFFEQDDNTMIVVEPDRWASLGMTLVEAMEKGPDIDPGDTSWFVQEKGGLIGMIEQIFFSTVETCMIFDRVEMIQAYNHMKKADKEESFHNFLLWQIMSEFDYSISHNMLLMIYNYCLRKLGSLTKINPAQNLLLYPESSKDRMPNLRKFLQKIKEEKAYDEALEVFG